MSDAWRMVDTAGPAAGDGVGLAAGEEPRPPGLRRVELERRASVLAGLDPVSAPWRWESVLKGFCIILGVSGLILSAPVPGRAASPEFSHALYDQILKEYIDDGQVDYARLKGNREGLDRYVTLLAELEPHLYETWNEPAKIAFWINAYNAITLKVILDHYPIERSSSPASLVFPASSIRQIPGVWDRITHPVMGRLMTLDRIEHEVLRKRFKEPRIHMALVCAAKGCPPLRSEAYTGKRLHEQLDGQTGRFLADPMKFRIDRAQGIVRLSSIFEWFGQDFLNAYGLPEGFPGHSETERAVLAFISRHLSPEDRDFLRQGNYRLATLDYDWTLNDTAPTTEDHGPAIARALGILVGAAALLTLVVAFGVRLWRR